MKVIILPFLLFFTTCCYGQSVISTVNSGADSQNGMVYSVGEIVVFSTTDPGETNSGLMGVLSQLEFFVTGLDNKLSSGDSRVYPNPTSHSLIFKTFSNANLSEVYIFDLNGRLISSKKLSDNKVDLSDLNNGAYYIKTNIDSIESFKIIKQ